MTKPVTDAKTGKRRDVARPRDEWLTIAVPAIVSEELFEAAQQRKQSNRAQIGWQRKHEYLLGGMLHCVECGGSMSGITNISRGKNLQYYGCNAHHTPKQSAYQCGAKRFRVASVDAAMWGWLKSILMEPERLRQELEN